MPATGENTGVAAGGRLIVNVPLATALCVLPEAVAMALIVVVLPTVIAPAYRVELTVGVVPSIV